MFGHSSNTHLDAERESDCVVQTRVGGYSRALVGGGMSVHFVLISAQQLGHAISIHTTSGYGHTSLRIRSGSMSTYHSHH